ncbi:MAG: hypothetical protein IKS23_01965 [Alphaproteobacteria bacterium]|nr:hypothetical protein [Alphaproteobacteria bacterium]
MKENIYEIRAKRFEEVFRINQMFRAVIKLAIKDAYLRKSKRSDKIKAEAMKFLRGTRDLKIICEMAGIKQNEIAKVVKNKNLKYKEKYNKIKSIL